MKKIILLFLSLFVLISCVACDGGEEASGEAVESSVESSEISEDEKSEVVSESESEVESEAVSESESSEVTEESNVESEAVSETESQPESNVPAPLDLVGTWKRVSTEVEGDVNDGGNCTIIISGTTEADLTVSYNDKDFPDTAYSDKALTITPESEDVGFGNGEWYAVVEYVGAYETSYRLILFEDGSLVLENSFMIDGMPMASFETFERAE